MYPHSFLCNALGAIGKRYLRSQRAHICQIESGAILPSFTLFIKICNALGTSADFLLGDYLENSVIPNSAERLGIQFKYLTPAQIEMISDMASVMIRYADKESD